MYERAFLHRSPSYYRASRSETRDSVDRRRRLRGKRHSDLRDKQTGLWEKFDAAELATPNAFERDPALVWGWYEWRRAVGAPRSSKSGTSSGLLQ